jgi:hypothetical protein
MRTTAAVVNARVWAMSGGPRSPTPAEHFAWLRDRTYDRARVPMPTADRMDN